MNEADIREALRPFNLGKMLDSVHVKDGLVQVALAIKREEAAALEPVRARVEAALAKNFAPEAIAGIATDASELAGDIHASPEYRAHLIGVMTKRAVAAA